MTQTYVLYHQNCYDGFAAAFAAWLKFGDTAEYIPVKYGDPPPSMAPGTSVYIVDFSYPHATLLELAQQHRITLLDHHKTAQEDLACFNHDCQTFGLLCEAHFDLEESGATLAWDYFHAPAKRPQVFELVKDRDLWRFVLPHSRAINAALRSIPFDFAAWTPLLENEALDGLATKGMAILEHQDEMVAMMSRQVIWRRIGDSRVPVVNATVYFSEIGDYLCQQYPDAPFSAYYLDRADGKRQWGLRSRGGFDCSAVAKQYGGGGHPGAAGFVTDLTWRGEAP